MTGVERVMHERSIPSEPLTVAAFTAPVSGGQQLSAEHRCLLRRNPLVSTDEQWAELESALQDSGEHGHFFTVLVETIRGRIVNKSDVHKTANGTLRALIAESYLNRICLIVLQWLDIERVII